MPIDRAVEYLQGVMLGDGLRHAAADELPRQPFELLAGVRIERRHMIPQTHAMKRSSLGHLIGTIT
jgi:hypothetical protein